MISLPGADNPSYGASIVNLPYLYRNFAQYPDAQVIFSSQRGFRQRFCLVAVIVATSAWHPDFAQAQVPSTPSLPQTQTFALKSVRVEGNTLLPEASFNEILSRLPGEKRRLADIKLAASQIQSVYREAGYGGVIAYVPEQALAAGDVVINVVEGKLAAIKISGNRYYDSANIRAGLPKLREGVTPEVRAIDRDIRLSNENPAKELKVTLVAGEKPGAIDAELAVTDENPLRFLFGFDNTGDPATGDYRLSLGVQHANLFGLDHVGTAQVQTSPGEPERVHIYSLGYRLPLYDHAASLDAFYAYSNVDSGTTITTAGPLNFTGKGKVFGLRGNRYLDRIGEYDHRIALGVDWREYDNNCTLGIFGASACGTVGADITIVPLSLAYTGQTQGPNLSWGLTAALSRNVGGSTQDQFDAARPGASRDYLIWKLSSFGEVALPAGFALNGRFAAQYSGDALFAGEQFGLGGASSVRGYREREIAGDYGFFASIEGLGPDLGKLFEIDSMRIRPLVFLDKGQVANHKDLPCQGTTKTSCNLSSIGIGARLALGKQATARFDIGRALENGPIKSAGSIRGHFAINVVY